MAGVVAAYVVVWFGVAIYVAWLGLQQRRTARRVEALESQIDRAGTRRESPSQAA